MSEQIKGITIVLDAETKSFKNGLAELNKSSKTLQTELREVEKSLKFDSSNVDILTQKQELLTKAIDETKNKIEILKEAKAKADKDMEDDNEINQEQYRKLQREISNTEAYLEKLETQSNSVNKALVESTEDIISKNQRLKTELEEVNKALKLDPTNLELVKEKELLLNQASSSLTETINIQNKELKDLQDEYKKVAQEKGKNSEEAKTLKEQMSNLKSQLSENKNELSLVTKESQKLDIELENLDSNTNQVNNSLNSMQVTMGLLSAGAIASLSNALKSLGTTFISIASNFEEGLSKVEAISGATASEMTKIANKAKELGSSTKYSATEVTGAFEYMALAGWDVNTMLVSVEGVLNLATAAGSDLAVTSDIVTDAMTAFKLSADETGKFVDILATTSSSANTNVELLGESFKYVAPLSGALGFSAEDTAHALGLMANAGIKGSQSGTSLKNVIARMVSPTKESSQAMENLGLTVTNSDGSMRSLKEILIDIRAGMQGMTEDQQAATASQLAGKEAMSGLLSIVNASEEEFNNLGESIELSNGSAKRMADTMANNLKGEFTALKSAGEGIAISLGELLLPSLKEAIQKIQAMAEWVLSLDEGKRKLILSVGGFVVVLTSLALIATQVISLITTLKTVFVALNTTFLASPIGIITVSLTALVAGFTLLKKSLNNVSEEAKSFKKETDTLLKSNENLTQAIEQNNKAYEENKKEISKQTQYNRELAKGIEELASVEKKSEGQKLLLNKRINELNESVDGLKVSYNEETKALEVNGEAVESLSKAIEQNISIQEIQQRQVQALEEETRLRQDLAEMAQIQNEAYTRLAEVEEELSKQSNKLWGEGKLLKEQHQELTEQIAENTLVIADLEQAQNSLTLEIDRNAAAIENYNNRKKASEEDYQNILTNTGIIAQLTADLEEESKEKVEELLDDLTSHATNAFDTINQKAGLSAKELINNITENTNTIEQWTKDLVILMERGVDEAFIQTLKDAGPEMAETVNNLVNATDEEIAQLSEVLTRGTEIAVQGVLSIAEAEETISIGSNMIDDIAKSIEDNDSIDKASKETIKSARKTMAEQVIKSDFTSVGEDISSGIAKGIENNSNVISKAIEKVADNAKIAFQQSLDIHSPSRVFAKLSQFINEGIAEGLNDSEDLSINAIKNISKKIIEIGNGIGEQIDTGQLNFNSLMGTNIFTNYNKIFAQMESIMRFGIPSNNNQVTNNTNITNNFHNVTQEKTAFKIKRELKHTARELGIS